MEDKTEVLCDFYVNLLGQHGVCIQLHDTETNLHFFTLLTLGFVDNSKVQKREWFLGFSDIVREINET
jgi:hypothetical protein